MAPVPTYSSLLERALAAIGNRKAIQDIGGESISGLDLLERIERIASAFSAMGLRPGDGIVQLAHNRIDAYAIMAGALRAGMRYTPLHPLGSQEDQEFVIRDAGARLLVLDDIAFPQRSRSLAEAHPGLPAITFASNDFGENLGELLAVPGAGIRYTPIGSDIAWISYTGGTTGRPKGVVHTQRGMAETARLSIEEWDFPDEPKLLACSPISHAAGFMVLPVLSLGGQVLLLPGFSPESTLSAVERQGVNALFLVPTMIYALLDQLAQEQRDLSNLEHIIYASSPINTERLREAVHVFGPILHQCYGQTESIHITCLKKGDHQPAIPGRLASAGRTTAGMEVKICDEDGSEVAPGEVGEVWVSGPCIMRGYWDRPEESEAALTEGWLHTGDLARADANGFISLIDRKKDLIISGGFNVYPSEVEQVLCLHPGVAACAVVGLPDSRWGERVHAIVVPKAAGQVGETELLAHVRKHKGPLMTPKSLEFASALPLTNLGKVDKRAMRAAINTPES